MFTLNHLIPAMIRLSRITLMEKTDVKDVLEHGIRAVVGTTGLNEAQLKELESTAIANNTACLICPNFAIGAVLMMQFATKAAKYLKEVGR